MATSSPPSAGNSGSGKVRQSKPFLIASSSFGMFMEVYDYILYGYLATIIAPILFPPSSNAATPYLEALLVFGVGYVMRPVGAVIFGHIGDRSGRKITFILTLLLMGISTIGLGLIPSYASIGISATVILVLLRLIQGIGLGGEFGASGTFIIEHAPKKRRAFYGSMIQTGWPLGFLVAVSTISIVSSIAGTAALDSWAWRVPFYVSGAVVVIGLLMRYYVDESPVYEQYRKKGKILSSPVVEAFKKESKNILRVVLLQVGETSIFYMSLFATFTLWLDAAKIPYTTTLHAFQVLYAITFFLYIAFGLMSDRIGRRSMFRWAFTGATIFMVPLFYVFGITHNILILGLATLGLIVFAAAGNATLSAAFPELLPANVRFSGWNIAYQLSVGLFGGFIPYITVDLYTSSHSLVIATFFGAIATAIGAIVAWVWLKETKDVELYDVISVEGAGVAGGRR